MKVSRVILLILLPFVTFAKDHIPKRIYDFKVTALDGKIIDFSKFKGKKILIVNTTSVSNKNPQYAELEALQQKYKDKLVVVGFLIDDFNKPPHPKAPPVPHLDRKDYSVTFAITKLVEVKGDGPEKTPVYKWLTHAKYSHFKDSDVQWDFQKYLVDAQGKLVAEFDSDVSVTDPSLVSAVEK